MSASVGKDDPPRRLRSLERARHISSMPSTSSLVTLEQVLRDRALAYPDATEDFPWGERAIKVRGKTFLFMRLGDG